MPAPEAEARVAVRVGALAPTAAQTTGWAVAFGICAISYYILRGFFSFEQDTAGRVLGWIGGPGKWLQSKIESAAQRVTHWVGQAAVGSERRMADAFHASGNILDSIGHEIEAQAIAYWEGVRWIGHVSWVGLKAADRAASNAEHWLAVKAHLRAVDRTERAHAKAIRHSNTGPIAAGTHTITRPIAARTTWIDTHELPNTRARVREHGHAIPRDRTAARTREGALTEGLSTLWDHVRGLDRRVVGLGAVALVVTALGRVGAGWVRCSNVRNVGRRLCGMNPTQLESLLAGTLAIVGTISIVQFAEELQAIVGEGADAIHGLIREK
jgi:hypothetical protein